MTSSIYAFYSFSSPSDRDAAAQELKDEGFYIHQDSPDTSNSFTAILHPRPGLLYLQPFFEKIRHRYNAIDHCINRI